jgi:hypothetical protein
MSTTEDLPLECFALIACRPAGQRIIAVRRGTAGYFSTTLDSVDMTLQQAKDVVDLYNRKLGVSEEQKQRMIAGSMFGWDVPSVTEDASYRTVRFD